MRDEPGSTGNIRNYSPSRRWNVTHTHTCQDVCQRLWQQDTSCAGVQLPPAPSPLKHQPVLRSSHTHRAGTVPSGCSVVFTCSSSLLSGELFCKTRFTALVLLWHFDYTHKREEDVWGSPVVSRNVSDKTELRFQRVLSSFFTSRHTEVLWRWVQWL